jgi:agmatine/peptidylarginine deiminase
MNNVIDTKGRPSWATEVEEPDHVFLPNEDGFDSGPALWSYANYVQVNGGIILPWFSDEGHDKVAYTPAQTHFLKVKGRFPLSWLSNCLN